MTDKKMEYIVIRDSFWRGVIGDVIMYGILLAMYIVNYKYLGNNGVLNVMFTILVIVFITNLFSLKYRHVFYSKEDAIKYLERIT